MATSCSHWWHAPIYFTMSVTLAVIAISASLPSHNNSSTTNQPTINHHDLSISLINNASFSLRLHGFNIIATLLQISPQLFFFPSPESNSTTIFAIPDSVISNLSVHPWILKQLLQYHTSPSNLPIHDLLMKPLGTCLKTHVQNKNIAITKTDSRRGLIEINNVLISHPDLFLDGNFSIHGVLGPFSSLGLHGSDQNQWKITESPLCDLNFRGITSTGEWIQVIRVLSSKGFVSFAIGLNSVLDGIIQKFPNLNSVTVFAPMNFKYVSSSSPLLDRIVRFHVLPQRFTHIELSSMPERSILRTLVEDEEIVITRRGNSSQGLAINGVEISNPDIFSSNKFMIHGISRALEMEDLSSTVR